jgi:putative ABC transport system substrate-binding protein
VTELLQRGADILVPCGTSASLAARRHSLTIPIVFINVGNPIAVGLVENLARPGGNATGFSDLLADLSRKHVDLAREVSKPQSVVDYLWHTGWADGRNRANVTEQAAQSAGVQLRSHSFADITEMDNLFAAMERDAATTLIIQPGPYTFQHRHRLIGSATDHGLATISAFPWAADGALIGYGADFVHMYRRAPFYVARVLKGTAPADLPVEQPSHIELAVNLNTAKTLRLELPLSLLVRANNLIE